MALYNSLQELLMTSDKEIETFFDETLFVGYFDNKIPEDGINCGKITNISIPGQTNKYLIDTILVPNRFSRSVEEGFCEFKCYINIVLLRSANHVIKLQLTRIKNIAKTNSIVSNQDKKIITDEDIRLFKEDIGVSDNTFIGRFDKNVDGSFAIRDIRRADFSKVVLLNGRELSPIVYHPKSFKPENGKYYRFSWILNVAKREVCKYAFKVDESKRIIEISKENGSPKEPNVVSPKNNRATSGAKVYGSSEYENNSLINDKRIKVLQTRWGKSIFKLVGVYTCKNNEYLIECVRKTNFSRLEDTPISIKLNTPLSGFLNGDCIEFSWKFVDTTGMDISVDTTLPIKRIVPQEIITRLYKDAISNEGRSTDLALHGIENNRINISGQDRNTFIYELLQNANDYPQIDTAGNKIPVEVEFEFEGDYLFFRHTGSKFTVQNVLGICGIGEKEKIDNIETIGYKGVGFKNVFIDCDYVYIKTGDYSFRFDKSKIERSAVSFETTPIWTTGIPSPLRSTFEKNSNFNVQIALRPRDNSIIALEKDGYIDRFLDAFSDPRIIIFIPWINKVTLIVPGKDNIVCVRNGNEGNWIVSNPDDLKTSILPEIKSRIIELIDSRQTRMPEKYKYKNETSVSFACMVDNKVIKPVEDSRIYCYLPTKDSWGFKFLMNTDMVPTGPRDGIEQQEYWNIEYSEIAGRAFFKWIKKLLEAGYDYDSVFSLVPDFEECKIGRNKDHVNMISRFQKGFEDCIAKQDLIPVLGTNNTIEYVCIKNIVLDITCITGSDVFKEGEFLKYSKLEGKLPHPLLRLSSHFKKILSLYGEKSLRFDKSSLWNLFNNNDFVSWLKNSSNNIRWINFVVEKYAEEYNSLPMFISGHDASRLYLASELYYDIDDALQYLSVFTNLLPRLSKCTRDNCKVLGSEKHIGKFKQYEISGLIDNIIFCKDNIASTQKLLEDKDNSVNFIKFLAVNQVSAINLLNKIPLTDIDGNLIPIDTTSVSLRKMFFNSDFVTQIRKEKWFSNNWVCILDNDYYFDNNIKEYLKGYNLSELDDSYVINSILVNGTCYEDVSVNVGDSIDISKSFVQYLFKHKDCIEGVEVENNETEKTTKYDRFTDYSLFFISGKGEVKYLPASKDVVFNEVRDDYLQYEWFDNSWIYKLSELYYSGKDETDKKELTSFFKKYFGLVDLSDVRFKVIVKDHFEEIKIKVVEKRELNLSFWSFLGKFQWNENSKDINVFKATPLLLDGDISPSYVADKKNLYYYHEELKKMSNSSWMPDDLITILSKEYDSIPGIKGLFDVIGFSIYDAQQFSSFFDSVIVKQKIPTDISEQVTPTIYNVSLDSKDKCVDFHNFMSKKYLLLNDIEKSLLRGTPVYVYGKERIRRQEVGYGSYVLGEDKFGILKMCAEGMLPEINALDTSFITDENLGYWKDVLGCISLDDETLCSWIEQHSDTISPKLQVLDQNIRFWTWLFDMGVSSRAKIGKLKTLPIVSFAARDAGNNEENYTFLSLSSSEAYMSNSYMGQAQIESFARKHGKNSFVSSIYIREADNIEEWRRFFRNLGVKDDVKDVIYSLIMNDLPTLKDKNLPWVLIDQYSKEIADPEKWKELAPKLTELQIETTTIGSFVSIANALRVTVDDYSQREPFKMVKLDGEISREYYDDENVKNLINKIAEYAKTPKITEFQQWIDAKINKYLLIQESTQPEDFRNVHFKFIQDWLSHKDDYFITRSHDIKLYDRENNLTNSEFLFLGSSYDCKCDFERFNILKTYVSDDYLKYGKSRDVTYLLRTFIGCRDRFKKEDINCLIDKDFSIYFWCKYVGSKDITIKAEINALVNEGAFNEVRCIPSQSGLMKKASELYSSSLKDYMKYIPDYQEKIIDPKMQFSEPLIELCKQCMETLLVNDCIDFLINSKPKNRNRTKVLEWLLDSTSEDKDDLLQKYRSHEKACWLNGQSEPSHLSSLFAIDPNNCNQAYVFKSSSRVIDMSYLPMDMELDVCEMLEIPVFSDDDLVPNPVKIPDGGQTLMVSKEIIRRLLLVIAYRYKDEWAECFDSLKEKMEEVKFWLCESISYGYKDLSIDNEDFYFDPISKTFYYVDSWQDKKVYESFVKKLCEYLNMDLDYRECKGKHDENFNRKKVARYLNSNCKDLFVDENFMSLINTYWKDVVELLEIEQDHKPDDDEEEPIEHVDIEKYYEDEPLDDDEGQDDGEEGVEEVGITHYPPASSGGLTSAGSNGVASPKNNPSKEKEVPTSNPVGGKPDGGASNGHTDRPNSPKEQGMPSTAQSGSPSSYGGTGSRQSGQRSSGQRRRPNYLEPKVATKEEIQRFKYKTSTKTFTTRELQAEEHDAINRILGDGLTAEQIVTQNYLAQLRFWGSLKDNDLTLVDSISLEDFIRDSEDDKDYELTNGKYIHRCSAAGGILYVSPSIWNMVSDDRCIICVFVGAKVDEFFYIRNKQDLLDWIADDAILIKLTGDKKVEAVNTLYSEILMDTKGTAYTMIRVAYDEAYNPLFVDLQNNDVSQPKINDDEYGD